MFIKQTQLKRGNRIYTYHRLVESVRTSKGARQRLEMSLGTLKTPNPIGLWVRAKSKNF